MIRNYVNMEEEYNELLKWFEEGKGQRVLEFGVYNDLITEVKFIKERQVIKISLTEKVLYVNKEEVDFLKIDEEYRNILMYLG